ncbi:sulfur carrier protein ThiS [Psychromonas sp. 14N.309.X.WAT.B.A12]|uniref:sulfur carrier protein ThiS n=1 Tax=unclassified Psychromonas TaxID=2614957 RepID=UPI0025B21231|nr:sulfur carrier protein ThiS [Psychromonas sp. 14N.309.X.WAT.B.A12]MDN2663511.1 sulfur carrier protein ThiS [Psychromonas sp. 14N.309.X.WAT.B.A12]
MKIQVNEQALILPNSMNLEQLLVHLEKPLIGSAVAVNMQVISRSEWTQYNINEGDNISLFQAIAGG